MRSTPACRMLARRAAIKGAKPHRGGPFVPREMAARCHKMFVQRLEPGECRQRRSALPPKCPELGSERRIGLSLAEVAEQHLQYRPLQHRDGGMVDQLSVARRGD